MKASRFPVRVSNRPGLDAGCSGLRERPIARQNELAIEPPFAGKDPPVAIPENRPALKQNSLQRTD
jgi:hypothetical protein